MVDIKIEELNKLLEQYGVNIGNAGLQTAKFADSLNNLISKNTGFSATTQQATENVTILGGAVQEFVRNSVSNISNANEQFVKLREILGDFSSEMADIGLQAGLMLEPLLNILPKTEKAFGQLGQTGQQAGIGIRDSFSGAHDIVKRFSEFLPGSISKLSVGMLEYMNTLAGTADQAQNLELSFLRTTAESGQFNELLAATGTNLAGIRDKMAVYSELVDNAATSTGKLSSEVATWANQLMQIPGALDRVITIGDVNERQMTELDAVMKVATGTGQTQSEAVETLSFAWKQLGVVGQPALELLARIGTAAQDLDMPMDIMRKSVEGIASSFKILGDNSQAAISIMGEFSSALQDSGIGPAAIAEITEGVTRGIQRMDIAHKAFVSAAAGRGGGLAGAFQIDLLMRQGKLDEVYNLVKQAMTNRFGGPIVTLEEASRTPALASELLKQVTFLKDVAGIAGTDADAYRILETMKTGGPAPEAVRTPEEALQSAIETGADIQQAQTNELINVQNEILRFTKLQSLTSLEMLRRFTGTAGGGEMAAGIEARMKAGREAAGLGEGFLEVTGQRGVGAKAYAEKIGDFVGLMENLTNTANAFGENVKDIIPVGMMTQLTDFVSNIKVQKDKLMEQIGIIKSQGKEVPRSLLEQKKEIEAQEARMAPFAGMAAPAGGEPVSLTTGLMLAPGMLPGPASPGAALAPLPIPRTGGAEPFLPGGRPLAGMGGRSQLPDATLHFQVDINAEGIGKIATAKAEKKISEIWEGESIQIFTGAKQTS